MVGIALSFNLLMKLRSEGSTWNWYATAAHQDSPEWWEEGEEGAEATEGAVATERSVATEGAGGTGEEGEEAHSPESQSPVPGWPKARDKPDRIW